MTGNCKEFSSEVSSSRIRLLSKDPSFQLSQIVVLLFGLSFSFFVFVEVDVRCHRKLPFSGTNTSRCPSDLPSVGDHNTSHSRQRMGGVIYWGRKHRRRCIISVIYFSTVTLKLQMSVLKSLTP